MRLEGLFAHITPPGPTIGRDRRASGIVSKWSAFRGCGHCSSIRFLCMSPQD
jgi:hypothetical protein